VVDKLVTPIILGVDFLHEHSPVLDFTKASVRIWDAKSESNPARIAPTPTVVHIQTIFEAAQKAEMKACAVAAIEQPGRDIVDACAAPVYQSPASIELPECPKSGSQEVVHEYQDLFQTVSGVTGAAYHFVPTMDNPVKVPPWRIPTHYREEVEKQIQAMLAASLKRAAAHGWHQLCLHQRNQEK